MVESISHNFLDCDIGKGNKESLNENNNDYYDHSYSGESLRRLGRFPDTNPPESILDKAEREIPIKNSADDAHLSSLIRQHKDNLDPIREHVKKTLLSHHELAEKTGNDQFAHKLTSKYSWVINHGLPPKYASKQEDNGWLSKDEIKKHTDDFVFTSGRLMTHRKLKIPHYLREDGTAEPVGHDSLFDEYHRPPSIQDSDTDALHYHSKELHNLHGNHIKETPERVNVVKTYTGDSGQINRLVISKNTNSKVKGDIEDESATEMHIEHMRSLIDSSPKYDNPMTVHTGLTKSSNPVKGIPTADGKMKSKVPGFMSTSLDPLVATEFGVSNARGDKDPEIKQPVGDVMSLKIPANHGKGIYVEPSTETKHEFEYILKDNHEIIHDKEPRYYARRGVIMRHWTGYVK